MRRRLAALAYESLILSAIVLVAGFLLAPVASISPAPVTAGSGLLVPALPARVLLFCALLGTGALYFGWCWTGGRRTLPMKTWHLRLTMRDGSPVDSRSALLRYVAAWIGPGLALLSYVALRPTGHGLYALWLLGLGYAWALLDPDRQFLHDRIGGTRIVTDPSQR